MYNTSESTVLVLSLFSLRLYAYTGVYNEHIQRRMKYQRFNVWLKVLTTVYYAVTDES